MIDQLWVALDSALGLGAEPLDLHFHQMALRCVVTFSAGLIMMRMGSLRLLGKYTPFDTLLSVLIGAVLSRAITGASPFFGTLGVCFLMVWLHLLVGRLAYYSPTFGRLAKGAAEPLSEAGTLNESVMRRHNVTPNDLEEGLRMRGHDPKSANDVDMFLERSGDISVVASGDTQSVQSRE